MGDREEVSVSISGGYGEFECPFRIRPHAIYGVIEIYNPELKLWIPGGNLWSEIPAVCSESLIRIRGMNALPNFISFYIRSENTGKVIKTNTIEVWNVSHSTGYLERLNLNILRDNVKIHK
jgi:hypothetical protein